tara:strand:- start:192 stop:2102 length:1911 start_codon:yes stop_codon:yes gene_type:complete
MIIIIPIGGIGKRFKDHNYKRPKCLINLFGTAMINHLIDNLDLKNIEYVFIPYNIEYSKFNFEDKLKKDYPNIQFKFLLLQEDTRGAAETINIALDNIKDEPDKPVLCLDSDNFYMDNVVNKWNGKNKVFTVNDENTNPIYSYINEKNGKIIDIQEKHKISNFACTGAYGFESKNKLFEYTNKVINENIKIKNEFYTSGVIKKMLDDRIIFINEKIEKKDWICVGTPLQLKIFYNNYPKVSSINNSIKISKKRICFDLDNTLVSFPEITGDYTKVKPIEKNINLLRYLKSFGNTIIIYTARRMKTHNGNIGKINSDIGKITFDTLDKFNIPYDEIYFGKPYADFYIDDLAVNCFDDIEKELGYYKNHIEPRDFNIVSNNIIDTIVKKSEDLSGEINYYKNIPYELKDMFPLLINFSDDNKEYIIEKINGITLTNLFLDELLTENTFTHILNSLIRIQNYKIEPSKINIYDNYKNKLKKRFISYDYSIFTNYNEIYNDIYSKLEEYENNNLGKETFIHGDFVFTNILINEYDKIKFIDMRGKVGNNLTLSGDWLYDWAKLYQSLIGYDKILQNKEISYSYEDKMINIFKDFFISKFSEDDFYYLKIITKSLLFTLIPLHNNNKCDKYFNLINSKYLI